MIHQDWTEIKWDKRNEKLGKKPTTVDIRKGNISTTNKDGKLNTSNILNFDKDKTKKIDKEEETFKHQKVSLNMGKKISNARNDKKLTQKEFANLLSLPLKIIQEYESSKAIPNHLIINKMEKFLGIRLRD